MFSLSSAWCPGSDARERAMRWTVGTLAGSLAMRLAGASPGLAVEQVKILGYAVVTFSIEDYMCMYVSEFWWLGTS